MILKVTLAGSASHAHFGNTWRSPFHLSSAALAFRAAPRHRPGIDPTVHEGVTVRAMEAKGIRTDKGDLNRWIKATNDLDPAI